jgi:hypothetical protein
VKVGVGGKGASANIVYNKAPVVTTGLREGNSERHESTLRLRNSVCEATSSSHNRMIRRDQATRKLFGLMPGQLVSL